MTYTTEELIQILDQELRASWKGERIVLSSANRIDNPVISMALGTEKLSKVFAYQDFQSQIHEYQKVHQVSGVVWGTCSFANHILRRPEIHNQLIAIPGDKEILTKAKAEVMDFWWQTTQGMKFWQAGHDPKPLTADFVTRAAQETEWAEIDVAQTELYLGLCWGNPKECRYQWAHPESGCQQIVAASDTPSAIKV